MDYNYALDVLLWELDDRLRSSQPDPKIIKDLRYAIMTINTGLFHKKIMGADPNNPYYAKK